MCNITRKTTTSFHQSKAEKKKHLPSLLFIDRDPYYYTRRVKEAIHIKPHPNNINRDSGIVSKQKNNSLKQTLQKRRAKNARRSPGR